MKLWPAHKDQQLMIVVFISVMLLVLFGSVVYKYGYTSPSQETDDLYHTISEDIDPVRETVELSITPTENNSPNQFEYQVSLNLVNQPTTGISIKLLAENDSPNLSFSDLQLTEEITNGPWQLLINKASVDPDSNRSAMQFAMASTDTAQISPEETIVLGTFTVTQNPQGFEIAEDSLLTTSVQAYDIVLAN